MQVKNTFKKSERLTNRTVIDEIFAKGDTIKSFPLILKYLNCDFADQTNLKVVVSVPKRRIRKAVDRNRIRRQIKEAYRLNRTEIKSRLENEKITLALFFVYNGKENPNYKLIEEKIKVILKELNVRIGQD